MVEVMVDVIVGVSLGGKLEKWANYLRLRRRLAVFPLARAPK